MKLRIITCLLSMTMVNAFSAQYGENTEFSDLYLFNCSKIDGVNICYPEREVNPFSQISKAKDLGLDLDAEDFCNQNGDSELIELCVARMRKESDLKICEIEFKYSKNDFTFEQCKKSAETLTSFSEKFDMDLLNCEHDYQYYLASKFREQYEGINISFTSETDELEFIHHARISPNFSADILLLPEHNNNVFCNEDGKFSLDDIDKRVAKGKELIDKFYSDEGIASVVEILDSPHENIPVVAAECPGLEDTYKAEKIGEHKKINPVVQESKQIVEEINSCVDSNVYALINFHESRLEEIKEAQLSGNFSTYDPTRIPYTAGNMLPTANVKDSIRSLCDQFNDDLQVTLNGVTIDGLKVPKLPAVLVGNNSHLDVTREMARNFKDNINEIRKEDRRELLPDGTYIITMMELQESVSIIRKAKLNSQKVAAPGNTFIYCGITNQWSEVSQGIHYEICAIDENPHCVEVGVEQRLDENCEIQDLDMSSLPGMYGSELSQPLWQPDLNEDDFSNGEFDSFDETDMQ